MGIQFFDSVHNVDLSLLSANDLTPRALQTPRSLLLLFVTITISSFFHYDPVMF